LASYLPDENRPGCITSNPVISLEPAATQCQPFNNAQSGGIVNRQHTEHRCDSSQSKLNIMHSSKSSQVQNII